MESARDNYEDKDFLERYKQGYLARDYIVFPAIAKILGDIKNKRVLDLGCGVGVLSRHLAEKGADVVGVDISVESIKVCREDSRNLPNLQAEVGDCSELKSFNDESFDIVIMNMVLLNIDDIKKVRQTFHEVSRVLKKEGDFIFTDLNPIGLMKPTITQDHKYLQGFSYFLDGAKFISEVRANDGSILEFDDTHWSLETYTKLIYESNMILFRIIEPQPIGDSPEILRDYKVPEYMIFWCKKNLNLFSS